MGSILQDLRHAVRALLRDRAFTTVALLTLALALGANIAIFTVVDSILLRPLPFPRAGQIVSIRARYSGDEAGDLSYPNIQDIRSQVHALESVSFYQHNVSFLTPESEPQRISGLSTRADLFRVLGVKPMIGAPFTEDWDHPGGPYHVVLSYNLWRRNFNSDPHIVGKSIGFGVAGRDRTVSGILPPGFRFPPSETADTDYLVPPLQWPDAVRDARASASLDCVGRLRDGHSIEEAQAQIKALSQRLEKQYPASNTGVELLLRPLQEETVKRVRATLLVLFAAVVAVLLIGCANIANLLLARAASRQREIAIRAAVGATRGRIVAQLLVESITLSIVGGTCGLLVAAWGIRVLVALAPPEIPRLTSISIDGRALAFGVALSLLTGIIFGLVPALNASNPDLTGTLKEGSRGASSGRAGARLRSALATAAIAISLVLLAGAGLLLKSFLRMTSLDPGYDYSNAAVVTMQSRFTAYKTSAEIIQFYQHVLDAVAAIPSVTSVGAADYLPLAGGEADYVIQVEGQRPPPAGHEPTAITIGVTPRYFETMRIPIRKGRDFERSDQKSSVAVVIISEGLARKYLAGRDPIGSRIRIDDTAASTPGLVRTVVGVVGDVRFRGVTDDPSPTLYLAFAQASSQRLRIIARSNAADSLGPSLRAAVRSVDPQAPIILSQTLASVRGDVLSTRRFSLILLSLLSAIALILAAVGIYSIMSYTVSQRTSEIGIRMALGAETGDILKLIVGQALRLVLLGVGIGCVVALAATRLLRSVLYGVTPTDPVTFVVICLVISIVAMLASWIPARRASRVDPLVAIRHD